MNRFDPAPPSATLDGPASGSVATPAGRDLYEDESDFKYDTAEPDYTSPPPSPVY
jgi:hypothetical protein